ncbi:MAG TPA: hypothetical protein VIJ07_00370 [Dermatophilaceae bacterium]|jgi:membrane associated rhomboid family serine protease
MSQQPGGGPVGGSGKDPSTVRRSPRFTAFLVTGGVIGLLIGVFLSLLGHPDTRYDASAALGFLGLICALLGVLVGGVIAVLLDRRS